MANAASELRSPQPFPPVRVRVMVVDDNDGFRDSLLALLDIDELEVIGEARSGAEALECSWTSECPRWTALRRRDA